MPEDFEIHEPVRMASAEEWDRLQAALRHLEDALDRVLAKYAALHQAHDALRHEYDSLRARNESVGEQLDDAIVRLKQVMAAGNSLSERK